MRHGRPSTVDGWGRAHVTPTAHAQVWVTAQVRVAAQVWQVRVAARVSAVTMVMQAQDAGRYKSPCGRKSRRYDVVTLSRGENAKNNTPRDLGTAALR